MIYLELSEPVGPVGSDDMPTLSQTVKVLCGRLSEQHEYPIPLHGSSREGAGRELGQGMRFEWMLLAGARDGSDGMFKDWVTLLDCSPT